MVTREDAAGITGQDSMADVIEGLLGEYADQLDPDVIFGIVLSCRAELTSCPPSALPERIRFLAQERLTAAVPST